MYPKSPISRAALLRIILFYAIVNYPCAAQEIPEKFIIKSWASPQGFTTSLIFQEGSPILLSTTNQAGDTLWKTQPGDEAHIRIDWNPEGSLLLLITNNQEPDQDLWTPEDEEQNHLYILDPRNGKTLESINLDTLFPDIKPPKDEREHTFSFPTSEKIEVTTPNSPHPAVISLSTNTLQEIKIPKNTRKKTGITWD